MPEMGSIPNTQKKAAGQCVEARGNAVYTAKNTDVTWEVPKTARSGTAAAK